MKKINFLLLSVFSLIIASCSSGDKDLLALIPEESAGVIGINVESLVKKSGASLENGGLVLPNELKSLIGDDKNVASVLKDLPNCGIDFASKAYIYMGSSDFDFALLAKIDDKASFEKFLSKYGNTNIERKGEYSYIIKSNELLMFSETALFIGSKYNTPNNEIVENGLNIFKSNAKNIGENSKAVSFLTQSDDLLGYFNCKTLASSLYPIMSNFGLSAQAKMATEALSKDYEALTFTMNFNESDIAIVGDFVAAKDSKIQEQADKICGKPSADFLKLIPNNMDYIISMSVNGKGLMEINEFKAIIDQFSANQFISKNEIIKIIENINGPISAGMSMGQGRNSESYIMTVKTSDSGHLITVINKTVAMIGLSFTKNGDEYTCSFGRMNIVLGEKDGYVYVRVNNTPTNDMAYSNPVLKDLYSKSIVGAYFNMQKGSQFAEEAYRNTNINIYGYMTSGVEKNIWNTKFVIEEPKSNNSLQTIIDAISKSQKKSMYSDEESYY